MAISAEHFILIFSIAVGVSVFLLGILVYANDRHRLTNRLFFYTTLVMMAWIASVLVAVQNKGEIISLVSERLALGFIALLVFLVYRFIYHFPRPPKKFEEPVTLLALVTLCMFVLTAFTPFVLSSVRELSNGTQRNFYDIGYYFFALYFIAYIAGSFYTLYIKRPLLNTLELTQMRLILFGFGISSTLTFLTNFVLPRVIGNSYSAQFGPVSLIFFLSLAAYTILRHRLFHVKVVATGFSIFSIWLFIFIRILLLDTGKEFIVDSVLLFMVGVLGVFLIRGVYKEIEQLEKTEQLAKKLQRANKELEMLDTMRREFLSFASHQLRTPLTSMKGFANLIAIGAYGEIPEKAKIAAIRIQIATDQLNGLINNLLDARAIEEGKMVFSFQTIDLIETVQPIVKAFEPRAKDRNLEIKFEAPEGKIMVSIDLLKFQEAIKNLIDNAFKYTREGFIKVCISRGEEDIVTIVVQDSGIGMSKKLIDKLFQQYVRDKEVALQGILGTGLGLYITRKIIEAHHGEIWVESGGQGKGSTFFIRIHEEKSQ
ncbi:MAG: ATP-binding protein [bacterium]